MNIIAFPFAGGNKYSFRQFLSKEECSVIEFPRENFIKKYNEKNLMKALVDKLFAITSETFNQEKPYCIYGHSMGGLVAYLIAQKIEENEKLPKPAKLIISGLKAPRYFQITKISHLNTQSFWEEIIKLDGIPKELENNKQIMDYFVPILKTDFKVIESYNYQRMKKLTIPIDVFLGKDEVMKTREKDDWKNESSNKVSITELSGGHFFINDNVDYFKAYFKSIKQLNYV